MPPKRKYDGDYIKLGLILIERNDALKPACKDGTSEALAAKTLPECFAIAMKTVIKVVNFIKKSTLNTCLFKQLRSDMNSEHAVELQRSGNLKLQGPSNIFAYEDKISAYIAKIKLWTKKDERENFSASDTLNQIIDGQCTEIKGEIQKNNALHLKNLKSGFNR
ncbi:unnamed protein product [Psylliodes chrysocephalus]|uniref:Uncharacterized protein n=1 Tax=Psylliodes chrysocephalus TaxID=3402493 RepID=A0A9P0GIB3_9CUCU|nr:unnamed protein product [Psylliodes chrysocephala]